MLKHIVMQINGKLASLFTLLWVSLMVQVWHPVSNLLANFILKYQSVGNQLRHLVKILLNLKALLVSLIIAVQSIKLALKRAVIISGQIGQQLLTIVRQIRQLVLAALKKDK